MELESKPGLLLRYFTVHELLHFLAKTVERSPCPPGLHNIHDNHFYSLSPSQAFVDNASRHVCFVRSLNLCSVLMHAYESYLLLPQLFLSPELLLSFCTLTNPELFKIVFHLRLLLRPVDFEDSLDFPRENRHFYAGHHCFLFLGKCPHSREVLVQFDWTRALSVAMWLILHHVRVLLLQLRSLGRWILHALFGWRLLHALLGWRLQLTGRLKHWAVLWPCEVLLGCFVAVLLGLLNTFLSDLLWTLFLWRISVQHGGRHCTLFRSWASAGPPFESTLGS